MKTNPGKPGGGQDDKSPRGRNNSFFRKNQNAGQNSGRGGVDGGPKKPSFKKARGPGGNKPFNKNRTDGDRSFNNGAGGKRPFNNRAVGGSPGGDRSFNNKPGGNRPFNNKPGGNRPFNNKPGGNRPFNNKPGGNRPFNNKPSDGGGRTFNRNFGNKPFNKNPRDGDRSFGGKKPFNKNQPNGERPFGGNKPHGKWDNNKHGGPAASHNDNQKQKHNQDLDALFSSKPEKLDYCLAPERLEAQTRALKRFENQDKEAEQQQRQSEKDRRHKLMTMKTKKGQPVMQGRMELLYEKVQKMVGDQD